MKDKLPFSPDQIASLVQVVDELQSQVHAVFSESERAISPVRRTVFQRFPIVFTLLVTFGVAATFFAFERILADLTYLHDRPWLILGIGIGVLVATGTLYKKLG